MVQKENKPKLSLDVPVTYQIKVPGSLEGLRVDWDVELAITVENDAAGLPVSTLTCTLDQAALQGLLRRLYSLGLPLISVIWVDLDNEPITIWEP